MRCHYRKRAWVPLPRLQPEVVPVVEVTLVRAPGAVGPVVEVALEPADKSKDGAK